jgi:hypothetical protein
MLRKTPKTNKQDKHDNVMTCSQTDERQCSSRQGSEAILERAVIQDKEFIEVAGRL